ncbi:MAG: hypothetical protein NTY01_19195 [Verrucomicrobia bacterium]|nr:hypothetical protein [Verrucomicrobiota bacterium]
MLQRLWRSDAALFGVVTALLIAPVLVFRDAPLYDLPNHLARLEVMFGGGAPGASQYYTAEWRLIPNLAIEGWVAVFRHVVPVAWAARIFLAATVVLMFWGAVALNRALFGRKSCFALVAALFAYNGPFLFGFVNLCFGLGLALLAVAAWMKWRERLWALPVFAALSCLILLAHLFAFAVYALVLAAFELGQLRHGLRHLRRDLVALLHLLIPAALYVLCMPRGIVVGDISYASWPHKLAELSGVIGFSNPVFDMLSLLALFLWLALGWRRIRLARGMALPLAALAFAFVLLPHGWGSATFVDYRVPATLALFLAASLAGRESEGRRNPGGIVVFAFFLFRLSVMGWQWQSWQADFAEYRAAFVLLPQGAKLLPLSRDPSAVNLNEHPPLGHIAGLAVSERGALIPDLFAGLPHELLAYRPAYAGIATEMPSAALAPAFDYVLLIRPEQIPAAAIPPYEELARGRTFVLGKLTKH